MLVAWSNDDGEAIKDVVSAIYPELRRIARQHLGRAPDHTLESAALANEAYLKLIRTRGSTAKTTRTSSPCARR